MLKINARQRKKILALLGLVACVGLIVGLVLKGLQSNLNLFLTPSEVIEKSVPLKQNFRLGGMVVQGSVKQGEGLKTYFQLTDMSQTVSVDYEGVLPDLFREGQGIVAEGYLKSERSFYAKSVLAKHDEKYMPPNLKNLPQQKGQNLAS